MNLTLTILATIAALAGYVLTYLFNKDKVRWYTASALVVAILGTFTLIWGNYVIRLDELEASEKDRAALVGQLNSLGGQVEDMNEKNDSCITLVSELRYDSERLSAQLTPFINLAEVRYPGFSQADALTKLEASIGGMRPKVVFLQDKTQQLRNEETGQIHSTHFFRSQYPVTLRDVNIRIRFDDRILGYKCNLTGAFVVEQDTKIVIDKDSMGLSYSTGVLNEGNDIRIEVISTTPLTIESMHLTP